MEGMLGRLDSMDKSEANRNLTNMIPAGGTYVLSLNGVLAPCNHKLLLR